MGEPSDCDTPLKATFKFKLNGETVSIDTVGQAYRFITELSSVEWMEFRSLHHDAVAALRGPAENSMLTAHATNTPRTLFPPANLLSLSSITPPCLILV